MKTCVLCRTQRRGNAVIQYDNISSIVRVSHNEGFWTTRIMVLSICESNWQFSDCLQLDYWIVNGRDLICRLVIEYICTGGTLFHLFLMLSKALVEMSLIIMIGLFLKILCWGGNRFLEGVGKLFEKQFWKINNYSLHNISRIPRCKTTLYWTLSICFNF